MVTGIDISAITLREHEQLIGLIDELIGAIKGLPNDIEWGDTSWMQDIDILNFVRIQVLSLQNARDNVVRGYYRDAYHLLRMIYEGYFILILVSTCDKYPFRIKIRRRERDPDIEHAKDRTIQEARGVFGDRLIRTYMEDGNTLVIVLRGLPVVDDQGQDTNVIVPYYYHVWQDFRPDQYHLRRQALQGRIPTLRFLTGEWASIPRKIKMELGKDYGLLYRYFLTFDRILDNLRLNGVLNKKLATRVLVHYNFLSKFSHSTRDSVRLVSTRTIAEITPHGLDIIYNHYFSELALLYICHLLSMHLQHAMFYLRWRAIKLKNRRRIYESLCRRVESDFGYFWFIFNKPHQYDRYTHANRKSDYRRGIIYRPDDIKPGHVRYYDDPLDRLKRMHQSQRELSTGNTFDSPFPANSVLPQETIVEF